MYSSEPTGWSDPADALRGTRVVVTGGAGFVGSHVVTRLLLTGARVKVVDNLSTGRLDNLDDARRAGLADRDLVVADIRGPAGTSVVTRWRPDVVVHLAAQTSAAVAVRAPAPDADANICGTLNVLDAAASAGVGLVVHAASSAIYGRVPAAGLPVGEETPVAPTHPYGISKATGLRYLDWYRERHGLAYTALVLGNVYGPRQTGPHRGVVARMAAALLSGERAVITGDGGQTRDFVYVGDVAHAVALACVTDGVGMVNIGTGRETSITEAYGFIAATVGADGPPRHDPPVPGEIRRMALDPSRAGTRLGWQPTVDLAEGVALVVADGRRRLARERLASVR
ncbi:NAD-dependent epimerase/dehydratase family protein [Micromonospora echinofusca]|uniref:NAD-dependent epimerase/dehydratase family protein n=2 Tax=Micromonospora echinofusca TaxID=47858 RepID=A0ABS3VRS8_MICEH|nr:NAD-dependent epimerase/dehydratase family protein [Micromonospora echinofusca]